MKIKITNFQIFNEQKEKIKNELTYFYSKVENKVKWINTLYLEITCSNENNEGNDYEKEFLESIPSNYILMNRIEKEYNIIYKFEFCFPLVQEIFEELNNENKFFIDISSPDFFKLPPTAFGINFDLFINNFFRNKNELFGILKQEIEYIDDDFCIENNIDFEKEKLFHLNDIISYVNKIKTPKFLQMKNKYYGKKNFENKKLILIFQEFNGKFVDILGIIRNGKINEWKLINFQIKVSNSFTIKKNEKEKFPYLFNYLRYKYEYILGIKIIEAYIEYIGYYECRKKFDINNENLFFFYSNKINDFVDKNAKKLEKIPFLKEGKVNFPEENFIIQLAYLMISNSPNFSNKHFNLLRIFTDEIEKYEKYVSVIINDKNIEINSWINGNLKNELKMENNRSLKPESVYYEILEENES